MMNQVSRILPAVLAFVLMGCTQNIKPEFIAVDQVGYAHDIEKHAYLVNGLANSFELVQKNNGEVVFMGMTGLQKEPDLATGDHVTILDFTSFKEPGTYYLRINEPKEFTSAHFTIAANPYRQASLTAIQSYYYHRCGTEVDNGADWKHPFCHVEDAPLFGNKAQRRTVTGGWHDAGDYNKFAVNTSFSTALLLYLYEADPTGFFDGDLNIPENKNGIPDLLDETKWALDWLLTMQNASGGVHHKVSQKTWIGEYLPHTDPSVRHLFEVSSASTASFAATTALASRLYSKFDPEFAATLRTAAEDAWDYLEAHPLNVPLGGFKNPPDVYGGEYGDTQDNEERMWAALELYRLSQEEHYLKYVMDDFWKLSGRKVYPLSWRNADVFVLNLIASTDMNGDYQRQKQGAKDHLVRHAEEILSDQSNNNYKNLNKHTEYYWGSNSVGLSYAFALIKAFELSGEKKFRDAALDQLHFVLGRNPVNLSQVTGVGSTSVQNPYHQMSELDGIEAPIPGMLVGGPNNHLLLNDKMLSPYPAKNYEDEFKNYLVNEPAINYTAIFAYVSGYLSIATSPNNLTSYDHATH